MGKISKRNALTQPRMRAKGNHKSDHPTDDIITSNSSPTQVERVVKYMQKHGSITQLEALTEISVMRLASRIAEIKKFRTVYDRFVKTKNKYGEPIHYKEYSFKKFKEKKNNG